MNHPCKDTCSGWQAGFDASDKISRKAVEKLQAENQKLREALEFYADRDNWRCKPGYIMHDMIDSSDYDQQAIIDGTSLKVIAGERARAALEGEGK